MTSVINTTRKWEGASNSDIEKYLKQLTQAYDEANVAMKAALDAKYDLSEEYIRVKKILDFRNGKR